MGACCITINVLGQTSVSMSSDAQQREDYINQHVTGLSIDQQSKIRAIEDDYLVKRGGVEGTGIDSLRRATDNNIRAVLSNQQFEQYQSLAMYPH